MSNININWDLPMVNKNGEMQSEEILAGFDSL